MANTKISSLPSATSLTNTTVIPVVESGTTKKLTGSQLKTYAQGGLSTVATSGSYSDLTSKPTIPTKTSDLTNDSNFLTTVAWSQVTSKPTFATVATSGSYNDLSSKPTIPDAQIQSDWTQADNTKKDFIKNKPSIPSNTSDLSNDSGFITSDIGNDLVPTTDNTYDLGSPTNRFRHLYVAPGTIYLGDIKLTNISGKLTAKKVINPGEVNEQEDTEDSDAFSTVRTTRLETLGDVEIDSPTEGETLRWNATDEVWRNSPAGGGGGVTSYNDLTDKPYIPEGLPDLGISDGQSGQVLTTDGDGHYTFNNINRVRFDSGASISELHNNDNRDDIIIDAESNVVIQTNEGDYSFKFTNGGDLELPNDILARPSNDLNLKVFDPGVEGAGVTISLQNRNADSGSKTTQFDVNPNNIVLTTDFNNNQYQWYFDNAGVLTLPVGGDIKNSSGTSVLGGGGGASTGDVTFDGYRIDQNQISQDVRVGVYCESGGDTVIYVAQNNRHSVRLFVQVEGHEGGGVGTWDTQACDVIAVQAFRDNSVSCSVFGITHTSTEPLATFSAQYNPTSERLEILCTPTNTGTHVYVSCQSIEINNND